MEDENELIYTPKNTSPINKDKVANSDRLIYTPKTNNSMHKTTKFGMDIHGYNLGIGESKYDDGITWNTNIDETDILGSVNEFRAVNQHWATKAAAGVGRIAVKAGSEIAKMPFFLGGAVMAIGAEEGEGYETAFNNRFIKAISEFNENVNTELLPVYVKKAISEGTLIDNVFSIDFWAKEGADGIGYIASMFAPGAAFRALGLGHKAMGMTAKGLAMVNGQAKLNGAVRKLSSLGINTNRFDIVGTAMANTLLEAGAEAGHAMENFEKQKGDIIAGWMAENPFMTEEQAEIQFKQQTGALGANVFKSNTGILIIPNLIMSKMIWGKGLPKSLSKGSPSVMNTLKGIGKRTLEATASEGFIEEAGQSTVENMFGASAKKGQLGKGFLEDFNIGELVDSYLDTISSVEGQKAMFLGAFLGGGMSSYQGYKGDKAQRKQTNQVLELAESEVNAFNKIIESDIYKRDEKGNIIFNNNQPQLDAVKVVNVAKALEATEEVNKRFEEAALNGDFETVNELKQEAINQLIQPFARQGELGVQALREHLEETSKAEDLQGLVKPEEVKDIIDKAVKQADYMQKQFQAYQDFSRELINIQHPKAAPEDIEFFYNMIADNYLNLKGQEYHYKQESNELEKKKADLLKDIGSEMIRTDNIIDEESFDDAFRYEYVTDPRAKLINDKIAVNKEKLDKIDKFINDEVWNPEKLNEAFKSIVDSHNKIREVEQQTEELEAQINTIKEINDLKELDKIKTDNPQIAEVIQQRREHLQEVERLKKEALDEENRKIAEAAKNNEKDPEEPEVPTENPPVDEDIATDGNNDSEIDNPPIDNENLTQDEINAQTSKLQPGAKVISTDRKGNIFSFIKDQFSEFINYERTPRNKSKDKVGFKINHLVNNIELNRKKELDAAEENWKNNVDEKGYPKESLQPIQKKINNKYDEQLKKLNFNWIKAVAMIDSKDFSNLEFLYNHLPINININGIEAPIETLPSTKASVEIFTKETLPMRKAIIDALAAGQSIEELSTNIVKQFPGQLKVQPQYQDETGKTMTPENDIRALQFFEGMSESEVIKEIAKRSYYVDYDGLLTNVNNKNDKISTKSGVLYGKGELYLVIPQNNGENFPLKLNFKRIDRDKGEAIYDIIVALSSISKTLDNPNPQSMSIIDFITNMNPELHDKLFYAIGEEIKLVTEMYPDEVNQTIDKLLDLLVHQKSINKNTLFNLDEFGNLNIGTLSGLNRVTKDELLAGTHKEVILDFLSKKRHNVLITIKRGGEFTFNNPSYVKYLLDNKIINTNAVVNEPTFQGYSTIYLNRDIQGVKEKSKTKTVRKVGKVGLPIASSKIADIERRKQEALKYEIEEVKTDNDFLHEKGTWRIINTRENPNNENLTFTGKTRQEVKDKINAKYKAELAALDNKDTTDLKEASSEVDKVLKTKPDSVEPQTKDDVKVNTDFNFETLPEKQQVLVIKKLTKELNITLDNSNRQLLATNKKAVFDVLINKAKAKNENIDNLMKRCGF